MNERTLAYGRRVMGALLGLDALYRAESADGDGLAVVNLDTAGAFAPDRFTDYDAARLCFADLRAEAPGLAEADRRTYYDELCRSTLAFVRWRQEGLSFEEQLAERPDDLGLLRQIADLREKRRDHEGALDCLDRVVQLMQQGSQTIDAELLSRLGELRLRVQEQRVAEAQQSGDASAAEGALRVLTQMRVAEGRRRVKRVDRR